MNDLEDKFYRLVEQHQQLKKDFRSNQHHMKHLNARLARLIGEKKRKDIKSSREIDMEELLFDMHSRITQLEKDNLRLRQNNLLYKTQLSSRARFHSSQMYTHVTARVDTGINRHHRLNRLRSQSTIAINCATSYTDEMGTQKRSTHISSERVSRETKVTGKLLEEARDEIDNLESIIAQQQQQLQSVSTSDHREASFERILVPNKSNQVNEGEGELTLTNNEMIIASYIDGLKKQLKLLQNDTADLQKYQLMCKSLEYKLSEASKRINELEEDKSLLEKSLHKCLDSCMSELKSNLNMNSDDHQSKHLLESYLCHLGQFQEHCQRVQREKDLLEKELMVEREVNSRLNSENELLAHEKKVHRPPLTDRINIVYPGDGDDEDDMIEQHTRQEKQLLKARRQEIQVEEKRQKQQQQEQQVQGDHGSHHLLLPTTVSEHELLDSSIGYSNSESLLDELQQMRCILQQVLRENDPVNSSSPASSF